MGLDAADADSLATLFAYVLVGLIITCIVILACLPDPPEDDLHNGSNKGGKDDGDSRR